MPRKSEVKIFATDVLYSKNYTETPLVAENKNFEKISDDFQEMAYREVSKNG